MDNSDFLVELLVEEIPARFHAAAIASFKNLITERLDKSRISYEEVNSCISPRRMVFSAKINSIVPEFVEEKRGPQVTSPNEIIDKFLKSNGISKNECEEKVIDKKTFLMAQIIHVQKNTKDLLGAIIKDAIINIQWPKSMYWGAYTFNFVRPIRNIMCIFNEALIDVDFSSEFNLSSTDFTIGHRFSENKRIYPKNFSDYIKKMKESSVIVDQSERRRYIVEKCRQLNIAGKELSVCVEDDLLDEVVGLVEHPLVLVGKIPEKFMKLPEEIIVTPLKLHQRYFPTKVGNKLAPYFVFVANNISKDSEENVIAGNERVLNARLSDALFFFETDALRPIESHLDNLKKIVFNDKLGTVYDRIQRIKIICGHLCDEITQNSSNNLLGLNKNSIELLNRATILSKCDLSTNMVCEFTELQGIMGAHYARLQGENSEVCNIIRDQYKPVEELSSPLCAIFSMADKIDLLVSLFAIGKEPTGSKDPFALRRAALGIIRIIMKYNIAIDLDAIVVKAFDLLAEKIDDRNSKTTDNVMSFIFDRIKVVLKETEIPHDIVMAVTAERDNVLDVFQKAKILAEITKSEMGEKLISVYKRAKNIIQDSDNTTVKENLLSENEERLLFEAINKLENSFDILNRSDIPSSEKFKKKLLYCVSMENVISNFFSNVFVNTDDKEIQKNRINILTKLVLIINNDLPEMGYIHEIA